MLVVELLDLINLFVWMNAPVVKIGVVVQHFVEDLAALVRLDGLLKLNLLNFKYHHLLVNFLELVVDQPNLGVLLLLLAQVLLVNMV